MMYSELLFLALRPFRNINRTVRFEIFIITLSIVISVAVVTTALNLFQGYQKNLKSILLENSAHVYIYPLRETLLTPDNAHKIKASIVNRKEIKSINPMVSNAALLKSEDKVIGCIIKGYDDLEKFQLSNAKYLELKNPEVNNKSIIIGKILALETNKNIGDSITIIYPQSCNLSPFGITSLQSTFHISNIINSGYYEIDKSTVIMNSLNAFTLFSIKPQYNYLEVFLKSDYINDVSKIVVSFNKQLGKQYFLQSWKDTNGNLFTLIEVEKWLIFGIFCILILIAAFNSISSVSSYIIDRRKEIAVFKALGIVDKLVSKIYLFRVAFVTILSSLMGLILGTFISLMITYQSIYTLNSEVYFIGKIYMSVSLINYLLVLLITFTVFLLFTHYPLKNIHNLLVTDILRGK